MWNLRIQLASWVVPQFRKSRLLRYLCVFIPLLLFMTVFIRASGWDPYIKYVLGGYVHVLAFRFRATALFWSEFSVILTYCSAAFYKWSRLLSEETKLEWYCRKANATPGIYQMYSNSRCKGLNQGLVLRQL